ncbi:MAG: hypothetical protein ACOX12_02780 [Eggerthellaceae bacterium]
MAASILLQTGAGTTVCINLADDFFEDDALVPKSRGTSSINWHALSRLDNLITLHQRKHDQLATLKKSLLEKMFV